MDMYFDDQQSYKSKSCKRLFIKLVCFCKLQTVSLSFTVGCSLLTACFISTGQPPVRFTCTRVAVVSGLDGFSDPHLHVLVVTDFIGK